MSETRNVELLRQGYKLWNDSKADSVGHWLNLVADDVKWTSLANGAAGMEFTAACGCKADVRRYFSELGKHWEMLHYTVEEFIAQGDRVVVLARCGWRNRDTGAAVETPKADILRMKDAKIVEYFEFYDTAAALAAAKPGKAAASKPS